MGSSASGSSNTSPLQQAGVAKEGNLNRTTTHTRQFWKLRLRPDDDDAPQDWWFASTAIPLLAATTGPLANVMSIAALITSWRVNYDIEHPGVDSYGVGFPDPRWCIGLNAASLVCGFAGNAFLLFNFTRVVRYIIALPITIILWYFATGILMGITISMNEFAPPHRPEQTYSQGFWHAVIAAVLYLVSSMLLMINMQGYFFGHYRQHFELTDEQRNLILQTMMFFIWLAGGAGVFARVEGWSFVDSLYFCDVTILTVGFGDFHPTNDVGRGLVFPYSVGGIIILGLMVSSIRNFAQEISHDNIIKKHVERRRANTIERSVPTMLEPQEDQVASGARMRQTISRPFNMKKERTTATDFHTDNLPNDVTNMRSKTKSFRKAPITATRNKLKRVRTRKQRLILLYEEKDRFTAMRNIQKGTANFKKYSALTMSVIAFGLLWCVGAIGFWKAEQKSQGLSYFQALYFCYVSLLTIGYGDLSPTSNAGKPFFIVWSLVAVPTMTILISDMGDTVIASFKRGTFTLGDWTVLPKAGIYRSFVERHSWLLHWLQKKAQEKAEKQRINEGFHPGPIADDEDVPPQSRTLEEIAKEQEEASEHTLAQKLAVAIRRTANHLRADPPRRYTYEEWVEYTQLIRFSRCSKEELEEEEEEEGLIDWDWIGEQSPMMAEQCESEWVLDRLCESLNRYMRKQGRASAHGKKKVEEITPA